MVKISISCPAGIGEISWSDRFTNEEEDYIVRPGVLAILRAPQVLLLRLRGSAHDSQYEHILDLGCAFGSNTMAHRHAYPNASEVIGIDLSEPALRWAYLAAVERDVSVRFEQRDARMTGYEDESFDLVTSFLLAHEVPAAVLDDILAESFRVLRPGGQIRFLEHPPYHALDPAVAFLQSFDYEANGERFWNEFLSRDFLGSSAMSAL